ncbi:MAG: AAA_13 domain-containing protein [Arenicellales bacterium IbO2]|nr:AAA family ATPase [Alphaproteobacteria bacterium]MDA8030535.1 AAA family ATPase [Alphaproteobacteria bacterium]MDA8041359.1 AAA family ATPase [Pirellulales bacterium]CAJ2377115.1 MAG: AAA_13 domain-containing protein [Arenicellales bacterium IbO2]
MKISRINKIRNYRIFRDFRWLNGGLKDFARFNLIYGWNGSGKTALSGLFAHLERNENVTETDADVEFELDDGTKIQGDEIADATVPAVRVFNRDYVNASVLAQIDQKQDLSPIYFLGSDVVQKSEQVQMLRDDLENAVQKKAAAKKSVNEAEAKYEGFCIMRAKMIKEVLLASPVHTKYNKASFKDRAQKIRFRGRPSTVLSSSEREACMEEIKQTPEVDIPKINMRIPEIALDLFFNTSNLLGKSVISQTIAELADAPVVAHWVQQGLDLHRNEQDYHSTCKFCGNEFSQQRQKELEGHFNDAVTSLQRLIQQTIDQIQQEKEAMQKVEFPHKNSFYTTLKEQADEAKTAANSAVQDASAYMDMLVEKLEEKKSKLFEPTGIGSDAPNPHAIERLLHDSIHAFNDIIETHNASTKKLGKTIEDAYNKLEDNFVLTALPELALCEDEKEKTAKAYAEAAQTVDSLKLGIRTLEEQMRGHRLPAEELNEELCTYLGHGDLRLEVKENGYALMRSGHAADNLSEGERTALAFLYFLKSLRGTGDAFDMQSGIVVIDDPISSLDANALFSAFSYMQQRTENCAQLFILTHNFSFFRQVKIWFSQMKVEVFYSLRTAHVNGERTASLSPLDSFLHKFDSEYQYLFKQVYEAAQMDTTSTSNLADFYGMPNVARRLLEAFLAYRFPDNTGSLAKKLKLAGYDAAGTERIRRFLNTYSHAGMVDPAEDDPAILADTSRVMQEILDLMESLDAKHYCRLEHLMKSPQPQG